MAVCVSRLSQPVLINTAALQEGFSRGSNFLRWIFFAVYALNGSLGLSLVYFPLMASVRLSGWGPEQASGWQGRVRANKLRLLHRDRRHLNILISVNPPTPPKLMLVVTTQVSPVHSHKHFGSCVKRDFSGFICFVCVCLCFFGFSRASFLAF